MGPKRPLLLRSTVCLCLLVLASSCDQPFDPRAPLQHQMVVYSILSTDRDGQFVRVQGNYMPASLDPRTYTGEHDVPDAQVYLVDSAATYLLQDTLLTRPDTSRYDFPIHAYILPGYAVHNNSSYTIVVNSSTLGTATATAAIPGNGQMNYNTTTSGIIRIPFRFPPETDVELNVTLSPLTQGYVCRMFVDYDVLVGNQYLSERAEIPIPVPGVAGYNPWDAQLPPLTLRGNLDFIMRWKAGHYVEVIKDITLRKYPTNRITFKWVVFTVLQLERNLYQYYTTVHDYSDPRSIRLDAPTYSSINGGWGLVGGYALDSLIYILPVNFDGNR